MLFGKVPLGAGQDYTISLPNDYRAVWAYYPAVDEARPHTSQREAQIQG
jgi:hypothetical protein